MGYEEHLADRIRELLGGEVGLTEKKMFGGLAFLIGGNMAVAASGEGLRVDDEAVRTERQLEKWVQVGAGYANTLPPKR
jgi:hypothetical protein